MANFMIVKTMLRVREISTMFLSIFLIICRFNFDIIKQANKRTKRKENYD